MMAGGINSLLRSGALLVTAGCGCWPIDARSIDALRFSSQLLFDELEGASIFGDIISRRQTFAPRLNLVFFCNLFMFVLIIIVIIF